MASKTEPPAPPGTPSAPAFGWVSVLVAVLGICLFPTSGPFDMVPENAVGGAAVAGLFGAVGVGYALAGLRVRSRPWWVSWIGLAASLGVALAAAVHIVGWW